MEKGGIHAEDGNNRIQEQELEWDVERGEKGSCDGLSFPGFLKGGVVLVIAGILAELGSFSAEEDWVESLWSDYDAQ